jgi:hypothetical protein
MNCVAMTQADSASLPVPPPTRAALPRLEPIALAVQSEVEKWRDRAMLQRSPAIAAQVHCNCSCELPAAAIGDHDRCAGRQIDDRVVAVDEKSIRQKPHAILRR